MKREDFLTVMKVLEGAYLRQFQGAEIDAWWDSLRDLRGDYLLLAVSEVVKTATRLPSVAEVRGRYFDITHKQRHAKDDAKYGEPLTPQEAEYFFTKIRALVFPGKSPKKP